MESKRRQRIFHKRGARGRVRIRGRKDGAISLSGITVTSGPAGSGKNPAGGGKNRGRCDLTCRPRALDEMNTVFVEELPQDTPLERPLHPPRRKRKRSPMPASDPLLPGPSGVASPRAPSPAAYEFIGFASSRSLKKSDSIRSLTSLGSESDSSDEENDELVDIPVPRTYISLQDTPEEDHCFVSYMPALADDSTTEYPRRLYDFQWRPFSECSVPPELRREKFCQSNVGPTTNFSDAYDAFTAIWDREIMEHIAVETNKYAQSLANKLIVNNRLQPRSRINDWQDTDVDELYTYFAIILAMGVVVKSSLSEYWSKKNDIFCTPGFGAVMSFRRFQLLSKCLHFNDNKAMSALQLNAVQAAMYKIEPIVSHLNRKFQELYTLDRNIALDESLLLWKGHLNINQLVPNKRARIGLKSYELCESKTGYLWRFEIHHQRQAQQSELGVADPMSAPTPSTVLRLVQGLENKGYTLWMDNYFNSPALARTLKSLNFDCAGTLRTNRLFVPEQLTSLTKENMQPGQITGLTSGDVDIMVWRDQARVATISTYHGNFISMVNGQPKPMAIYDYNIQMGGIDKKDQMLAMYPIERKRTQIWYKKLFRRLLNVSTQNAYILTKHSNPTLAHREFRISLVSQLQYRHTTKIARQFTAFEPHIHYSALYPINNPSGRLRRLCAVCRKRTRFFCKGCDLPVCMEQCFCTLHSKSLSLPLVPNLC